MKFPRPPATLKRAFSTRRRPPGSGRDDHAYRVSGTDAGTTATPESMTRSDETAWTTRVLKSAAARSPWLYRINAGSCNGCDVELAVTALIPRFDLERRGCRYCGSPKHADIVLVTGLMTRRLKDKVMRLFSEVPDPKVTVAIGICPVSGCVYQDSYAVDGPVDRHLPIDINILGCPPRPQAIISGLAQALDLWRSRL